ncbi:g1100 [Coccomyxa viridis]|uniref:G1100 protein n=1 Tax=Coccomyxa viridis TaxID=1274662 RepID=A0ABP1FH76_9CHLO
MFCTGHSLRQDAVLHCSWPGYRQQHIAAPARQQQHLLLRQSESTRVQGSCRSRLHIRCAAEVKTNDAKQAEAGANGKADKEPEYYEVTLAKPLGVRFTRGGDGGAYVVRSDPKIGNTDPQLEVGDKIVGVSASFGTDIWDAQNFGQVMYAIKTRNGDVYLKMKRNYGDTAALMEENLTDAQKQWQTERRGGNYGMGTKEMQARNYMNRKETEQKRRALFDTALSKFKKNDIEGALQDFEEVISMEPKNYLGDDFSRITQIFRVAQYNLACCYSAVNQVDAGLEALEAALSAGFEQFNKVRTDPNLDALRKSPKFKTLIDSYDEPVFNDNAIKAIKNLFSFGKKKDDDE